MFGEAVNSGDADTVNSLYTEDAVGVGPRTGLDTAGPGKHTHACHPGPP
jgi:ketosteroid isomerase-like protein